MPVQGLRQLVRVPHGSHLYGTSTPTSDQDFKGVHLPSGDAILLGKQNAVIDNGVVAKDGTKNTADAIDDQSYPLHKFFKMLMDGDTVATEILFAEPSYGDHLWPQIQMIGRQLLNRKCKGFVGYCVRQAAKYGIKGSRMADVKLLRDFLIDKAYAAKLSTIEPALRELSKGREHMSWENIPHPDGKDCWHIVCCDRKMPMTATIGEAFKVFDKVWENYGARARAAMTNEGIDWKAMSHAVRVAQQALELLNTGKITFPRPNARLLLDIKLGLLPYGMVSELLEGLVEDVRRASERSHLPEESDQTIADWAVLLYYKMQVTG